MNAGNQLALGIAIAVRRLSVLRYFPTDDVAQEEVMKLLHRMVSDIRQLDWLIGAMIDEVGEWRGPMELRGVFCSRFKPKDGKQAVSRFGRFSPEANEGKSIEAHNEVKQLGPPQDAFAAELITDLAERKRLT